MSMSAWIVVGDQPAVGNLIAVARSLGGPVGAVVAGPRPVAETVAGGRRGQGALVQRAG